MSGYHQPEPGAEAELDGLPFQLGSTHAARAAGLWFVHQDLALVLQLSILDNMMLGRTYPVGVGGRIRWRAAADSVGSYLRTVGVEADARSPVGSLSLTERSAVAIARALSDTGQGRLLLVLDEPTAALPSDDIAGCSPRSAACGPRATACCSSPTTSARSSTSPTGSLSCAIDGSWPQSGGGGRSAAPDRAHRRSLGRRPRCPRPRREPESVPARIAAAGPAAARRQAPRARFRRPLR